MHKRLMIFGLLLLIAAGFYVVRYQLPDQHDPFAPLSIAEPPGLATSFKLRRINNSPRLCLKTLYNSDLKYQPLVDRETGKNCGFFDAVKLQQSTVSYGGDISLTCPALVALAIWERHELRPLARRMFGQDISQVRHFGSYACRNINNASKGRRSEHALANAIDIAGFVLADGTDISIQHHWNKNSTESRFLHALQGSACRYFSTVLGPDYNSLHHDHLHLDMGFYQLCR